MSYFPRPVREIISEDKLTLVDRMYQPGDLLKRSVDDVRSGMVTGCVPHPRSATSASHPPACASPAARSATVLGRLEHAISGESVSGWKRLDEVDAVVADVAPKHRNSLVQDCDAVLARLTEESGAAGQDWWT